MHLQHFNRRCRDMDVTPQATEIATELHKAAKEGAPYGLAKLAALVLERLRTSEVNAATAATISQVVTCLVKDMKWRRHAVWPVFAAPPASSTSIALVLMYAVPPYAPVNYDAMLATVKALTGEDVPLPSLRKAVARLVKQGSMRRYSEGVFLNIHAAP